MLNVWGVKTGYFFAAISFVGGGVLLLTVPEVGITRLPKDLADDV